MNNLPNYSPLAKHWGLRQDVVYLNHGSFGATPASVLQQQQQLQQAMEGEAIEYFIDKLPDYIQASKKALATFVGTSPHNVVFVPNTTTGVNVIFNSIPTKAGNDWLITSHNYGACIHAAKHYAKKNNCNIITAQIPYPTQSEDEILNAIEQSITPNTTLALVDYVTSATALVFPIKKIIELLQSKGIKVLVDAAHAPGMIDFSIDELKPDFLVANCHKWICSPKGSAFMYVAPQHQQDIHPLVISHYNDMAEGTPAHWSNQFMWDGTHDYSAYICVKDALETMPTFIQGGWDGIKKHNHNLVWQAATKIANGLHTILPVPESMVGSICNIPMPNGNAPLQKFHSNTALKNVLFEKYHIEVPVTIYPAAPTQWLRISAQLYNSMEQYDYLLACLQKELS